MILWVYIDNLIPSVTQTLVTQVLTHSLTQSLTQSGANFVVLVVSSMSVMPTDSEALVPYFPTTELS